MLKSQLRPEITLLNKETEKKTSAPALSRGLRILELIASSAQPPNLTMIAAGLGVAMSSAHSLCTTLIQEGYVEKASDGTFSLTLRVLDLASSKINKYEIVEHFYAACDEIQLIRENGATMSCLTDPMFCSSRRGTALSLLASPSKQGRECQLAAWRAAVPCLAVCQMRKCASCTRMKSFRN